VEEIQQNLLAQAAQIAGDNQIIVRGPAACVPKMGLNGIIGGGGHSGSHIVSILDALVHNLACGHMGDIGARPLPGEDDAARPRHRPLGGGGALAAVLQGRAVLPFGGAEMGGGHGGGVGGETAVQQQGGQRQALRHSGTGAIQPEEGDVLPPDGEAGANALVEQVAGQNIVQGGGAQPRLVQRGGEGQLLHGGLRLLPGLFPKRIVLIDLVEAVGQRALPFFFPHHIGVARDGGRVGKGDRLPAQLFCGHSANLLSFR